MTNGFVNDEQRQDSPKSFWSACSTIGRHALATAWLAGALLPLRSAALAQEAGQGEGDPAGGLNVKLRTWGGKQLWGDELVLHDWRIQRNLLTGHYRLLDGNEHRHAWGSFEHCKARLQAVAREHHLQPMRGEVVVVMHGLFRTRSSMHKLANYLRETGGNQVIEVGYPTALGSVSAHAQSLDRVLRNLPEVEQFSFVAHSLGNLVIRHWLADQQQLVAEEDQRTRPRVKRVVMLGPPNNGAELARKLVPFDMTDWPVGAPVGQFAYTWEDLASRLATPQCDFGIIAGGRGDGSGFNPLIAGDDDMVVAVDSTRLAGARDFRLVPVLHSFIMNDERVMQYTQAFLKHGHFETEAARQPIEEEAAPGRQ